MDGKCCGGLSPCKNYCPASVMVAGFSLSDASCVVWWLILFVIKAIC